MSTSNLPSFARTMNYALPALTLLLGTTGVVTGYLGAETPAKSADAFGLPLSSKPPSAHDRAYLRALGARNTASGLSLLSLMGLYGLARWDGLSVASTSIKRCIGAVLVVGMTVGLADGALLTKFADEKGGEVDGEKVREKGFGHTIMAGVIGLVGIGWLTV